MAGLAQLRGEIQTRFWLHLGEGWRFFAPERYITRLTAVLDAEPEVFQVAVNFEDAAKLTGLTAPERHRAPDHRRRPLRPDRCGGERPGDVRHHTSGSGGRRRQHRSRSVRTTRPTRGRCRDCGRRPSTRCSASRAIKPADQSFGLAKPSCVSRPYRPCRPLRSCRRSRRATSSADRCRQYRRRLGVPADRRSAAPVAPTSPLAPASPVSAGLTGVAGLAVARVAGRSSQSAAPVAPAAP